MNTKSKSRENILEITVTGVMIAAVFVVTRFIQIPIPLGYFNVGNSVILLFCLLVSKRGGIIGGSVGSALADLTSYPIYTIPTLIIKAFMPWIFYVLTKKYKDKKFVAIFAVAVATLIPLFGYTLTGCFLSETFITGLAQFPGLFLEYVANLVIFAILFEPVKALRKFVSTSVE